MYRSDAKTAKEIVTSYEGPLTEAVKLSSDKDTDYAPSGSTPLYNSVGTIIKSVRERVAATKDKVNVIVSIFTDGENNSRNGYTPEDVAQMVEECEGEGWTFTYFGANQDAWEVGATFGIKAGNSMSYSTDNMNATMATASMARSYHKTQAKAAHAAGATYSSTTFFADAGQTEDDYQ